MVLVVLVVLVIALPPHPTGAVSSSSSIDGAFPFSMCSSPEPASILDMDTIVLVLDEIPTLYTLYYPGDIFFLVKLLDLRGLQINKNKVKKCATSTIEGLAPTEEQKSSVAKCCLLRAQSSFI